MDKVDIKELVSNVAAYCAERGIRFTDPRRHVLSIIAAAEKPIGAYDVLDALGQVIDNPKPPTAYRAIEFLVEHGFIHRIESLNAYIICHSDHKHQGSQFMVCNDCGKVIEAHLCHLPDSLAKRVEKEGFHLAHWNIELHGSCVDCR